MASHPARNDRAALEQAEKDWRDEMDPIPCRCAGCHALSEPRRIGLIPDDWRRSLRSGYYYCPACVAHPIRRPLIDREPMP